MTITPEQALQRLFASDGSRKAPSRIPITLIDTIKRSGKERLYAFQRANTMLIAPADDTLQPIMGVCDGAEGEMPHSMRKYLNEIAHEVAAYQESDDIVEAPMAERESVEPLVTSQWGQGSPFNKYLNFGDGACLVGCNNIALGQIMYYWGTLGYHRGCMATKEYTTKTKKYAVEPLPPITVFDYPNLTAMKPTTTKTKKAVGKMLEYISKACKSDFTPSATSASVSTCLSVIKKTVRMGDKAKKIASATIGAAAFESAIYQELVMLHPVYMAGYGGEGGHAFVCDGYDAAKDLYHFNWGYNGKYDGWFAMNALKPGTHDYNGNKSAIVGIVPTLLGDTNGDGHINMADVTNIIKNKGKKTPSCDINSDGVVDMADAETLINYILGNENL